MSGITLSGVEKRYPGGVLAVDGVDIDVESGEFVTLVGPSGCGKTTTLRTIAGFELPTKGTVSIGGVDVTNLPPYKRDTGMVFQDFALFPHLSVYENVAYGMRVDDEGYSDAEIEARVAEMLELVELPDVGDRKPDQLSGGQQQRIALARALAAEPDALLLDEPLASLDKKLREQMQVELRRIQEEVGITTVFVTHNQEEALTMSDRIAVMNEGKFEQVGPPNEVYNRPDTRFVGDFLGTANIFDGTVTEVSADTVTVDAGDVTLTATPNADLAVGDDAAVIARPERLTLSAAATGVEGTSVDGTGVDGTVAADGPDGTDGADGTAVTTFHGEITFKRHLGSSLEYHFETDAGRELVMVQRNETDELALGEEIEVDLSPDDCLAVEG